MNQKDLERLAKAFRIIEDVTEYGAGDIIDLLTGSVIGEEDARELKRVIEEE